MNIKFIISGILLLITINLSANVNRFAKIYNELNSDSAHKNVFFSYSRSIPNQYQEKYNFLTGLMAEGKPLVFFESLRDDGQCDGFVILNKDFPIANSYYHTIKVDNGVFDQIVFISKGILLNSKILDFPKILNKANQIPSKYILISYYDGNDIHSTVLVEPDLLICNIELLERFKATKELNSAFNLVMLVYYSQITMIAEIERMLTSGKKTDKLFCN